MQKVVVDLLLKRRQLARRTTMPSSEEIRAAYRSQLLNPESKLPAIRAYLLADDAFEKKYPTQAAQTGPQFEADRAALMELKTRAGQERWPVKTATDAGATAVAQQARNQPPTTAEIEKLVGIIHPNISPDVRSAPYETTVYVVKCILTHIGLEDDGDLHLVIASSEDPGAAEMIAEVPDPNYAAGSAFINAITATRAVFLRHYPDQCGGGEPAAAHKLDQAVPITITGVGFFDYPHRQTGAAPNQAELHPVIDAVLGN